MCYIASCNLTASAKGVMKMKTFAHGALVIAAFGMTMGVGCTGAPQNEDTYWIYNKSVNDVTGAIESESATTFAVAEKSDARGMFFILCGVKGPTTIYMTVTASYLPCCMELPGPVKYRFSGDNTVHESEWPGGLAPPGRIVRVPPHIWPEFIAQARSADTLFIEIGEEDGASFNLAFLLGGFEDATAQLSCIDELLASGSPAAN